MTAAIHATKLHRPRPRANWIARARLLAKLDRGLRQEHRLILVSAPAGAGKTTLLGHWLAERQIRAAWLSLDQEDDEPIRFWICTLQALQTAVPGLGQQALDALNSQQPPPVASLLPGLLNEIGGLAEPLVLVLDDYHVLTAGGIHESVAAMLEHLPEPLHVVLGTRADPPLPLARWRAKDQLTEVRAGDLRFTTGEALAFLNERMALNLQVEDAERLVERTEGWAVGLQLAALSLQGQADPSKAIQSFAGSQHYVLDYLLEEVLARQPEPIERFLIQTSILDRLCGPLCDAVTGEQGGTAMLAELQRQNLFLLPLDDDRYWYRYHHLFADLLRVRLQQLAPESVKPLHLRASAWYEEQRAGSEAVRHALAAQDWQRVAHLLEAGEHDWWTGSDVALFDLIRQLPDEVIRQGADLSVYKAWFLLISGQLQNAAALLSNVELSLSSAGYREEQRGLLSFVAMQQAYIAELTGEPGPRQVDPATLAYVPEGRGGMRNSAEVILAYVLYRNGDFGEAGRLLQAAMQRDLRTGATNGIPISVSRLARMWILQGRLQEAADLCRKYLPVVEERGKWRYFVGGNLSIVLGDVLREWNHLDEAEAYVRTGIEDNAPWTIAHAYALGHTALARLLLAKGDIQGAEAALAQQEQLTGGRIIPPDLTAEIRAVRMRLWLASGDLAAVANWADAWAQDADAVMDFRHEQDWLTLARAWLALGKVPQAAGLLARLREGADSGGRARRSAEILLLLARARQAEGEIEKAMQSLEQSLALALPMGCVRMFLDEGPDCTTLLTTLCRRRDTSRSALAFAQRVLALAPVGLSDAGTAPASAGREPLAEPLTPREREVLTLLSAGHSNQDIADRLVITLHAVKKHTGNIYGKLSVTSRTQAIARAGELGLLPER